MHIHQHPVYGTRSIGFPILYLLLIFLTSSALSSQSVFADSLSAKEGDVTVSGTVHDLSTQVPIPDVLIESFNAATDEALDNATSAADGSYTLSVTNKDIPLRLRFTTSSYDAKVVTRILAPYVLDLSLAPKCPAMPANVRVIPGAGEVFIRWDASKEPDVVGYNVYRAFEDEEAAQLNSTIVGSCYIRDASVENISHTYTYSITAIDSDGNESQHSNTIPILTGAVDLWTPDIQGAAGSEIRIPLNLTNARGISPQKGFTLFFNYSARFFNTPDSASVRIERTTLTQNLEFDHSVVDEKEIQIIVPEQTGYLLMGEGHLFDMYLEIDNHAPAGSCSRFYLDATLSLPGGTAVDVNTPDSMQICEGAACVLGDLNEDDAVTLADVTLALQLATGLLEADDNQRISADINGDGVLNGIDALLIDRLRLSLPINADGESVMPSVMLPTTPRTIMLTSGAALPSSTVTIPVTIDNGADVSAVDIEICYPSDESEITLQSVELGQDAADFNWEYNDNDAGYLRVSLFENGGLLLGPQVVLELTFAISETVPSGTTFPVALRNVLLSGVYGNNFDWQGATVKIATSILVEQQSILDVTPLSRVVGPESGTVSFTIGNGGTGIMAWNAAIDSGSEWLSIESGEAGNNTGTVEIAFQANHTATDRQGGVEILSLNAQGSPTTISITQQAAPVRLTVAIDGNGNVSPVAGIHEYSAGSTVSLSADSAEGWRFSRWEGAVASSTSANTTIQMNSNHSVTAVFVKESGIDCAGALLSRSRFTPPAATYGDMLALGAALCIVAAMGRKRRSARAITDA